MKKATIYDVAGAAGVSLATVSRVLNAPEKVAEATKERVKRVIKELDYRPNLIARGLASSKTTTVGVIVSDITRASVAEMLAGIADIAVTFQYQYTIKLFTLYDNLRLKDTLYDIVSEQLDGIIFLHDELSDESLNVVTEVFSENSIPFVFANVSTSNPSIPVVEIDYEAAGYEVTKELIKDNRKNIFLLNTKRSYSVNDNKERGYQKAMQEAGLIPQILLTSGDTAINKSQFKKFFESKIPIDAAIAVRDSIGVSFMNSAITDGQLSVPRDLAVIGFQNTKYAELARPTLTTIDVPVYDIGAVAMRLLTKLMNPMDKEISPQNEKVVIKNKLPHKLKVRESTN